MEEKQSSSRIFDKELIQFMSILKDKLKVSEINNVEKRSKNDTCYKY